MTLRQDALDACDKVAREEGLEPARLKAVVLVESSGKPYEAADTDASDGLAPTMLFEKHVFLRELKARAPHKVADAERAGLTAKKWNKAKNYVEQKSSAGRLEILRRACAIDEECAKRATSVGLFQIMGFHATDLGFASASEMYARMEDGLVAEQIRIGVLYMRKNGLIPLLAAGKWADFAERYNGKEYRKNAYDKKLAAAYATFQAAERSGVEIAKPTDEDGALRLGSKGPRVRALQEELTRVGYVTNADGDFGPTTQSNVVAFQFAHQKAFGLKVDGIAGPKTVAALEKAEPISKGSREAATTADVVKTSTIAQGADLLQKGGKGMLGVGGVDQVLENGDTIIAQVEKFQAAADKVSALNGMAERLVVWAAGHWQLLAVGAVVIGVTFVAKRILAARVEDHRLGKTV